MGWGWCTQRVWVHAGAGSGSDASTANPPIHVLVFAGVRASTGLVAGVGVAAGGVAGAGIGAGAGESESLGEHLSEHPVQMRWGRNSA